MSFLGRVLDVFRGKPAPESVRAPAPRRRLETPKERATQWAEPGSPRAPDTHELLMRIRGFQKEYLGDEELTPDDAAFVQAVEDRLSRGAFQLPLLPQTTMDVMGLLANPRAQTAEIGRLVSQDQVLTTRTLRMANSAFYRGMQEIANVELAIARLGLRQLRALLLTISAQTTILQGGIVLPLARRLWEHSVGCAVFCRGLSKLVRKDDEKFFVAGLLHDIGKVPVLEAVREVSRRGGRRQIPSERVLTTIFDSYHGSIGKEIAAKWSLPEEIVYVVGHHHDRPDGKHAPSTALVAVANHMCHASGEMGAVAELEVVESAGLSHVTLRDWATALPEMVEEISERLAQPDAATSTPRTA